MSLVICMQRCGPSGMFLRSACFGMFTFGMFKFGHLHLFTCKDAVLPAGFFFPRASAHTHTHFWSQVLVLLVVDEAGLY